jgi:hypothetical protein
MIFFVAKLLYVCLPFLITLVFGTFGTFLALAIFFGIINNGFEG